MSERGGYRRGDGKRQNHGQEKGYIAEKNMDLFHDIFLKSVEANGRVHELGLILGFNLQSGQPLKDAQYGLPMVTRGKLAILPHKSNGQDEVKKYLTMYGNGVAKDEICLFSRLFLKLDRY